MNKRVLLDTLFLILIALLACVAFTWAYHLLCCS